MQTFVVKTIGKNLTPADISTMIWQCSELLESEILVEEQ